MYTCQLQAKSKMHPKQIIIVDIFAAVISDIKDTRGQIVHSLYNLLTNDLITNVIIYYIFKFVIRVICEKILKVWRMSVRPRQIDYLVDGSAPSDKSSFI